MTPAAPYAGSRDARFVTIRRGGILNDETHHALALWAADCAEHVHTLFSTVRPEDHRPAHAIATARAWALGRASMTDAREAASAAHAAARATAGAAALAARAAGHAAATAHMADHELGPAFYALQALECAQGDQATIDAERRWQVDQLAPLIKELVLDDMRLRSTKFPGAVNRNG